MAKQDVKRIGVIGLGKMGRPIARHLIAKGYSVVGCDPHPAAMRKARALGVRATASPAVVASSCDIIIILVGFDAEVDEVLFGKSGIATTPRPGLTVAISSTVSPAYMRSLPARAKGKRITFLDAPLCRGEPAAEAGKLLVMGGGDKATFERCRRIFEAFSDAVHYLGKLGAGQVGKMVNNLILWGCASANYEGLRLAATLGVNDERLRRALLQSSANNWALGMWRTFGLMPWAEKDMTIVLQEADEARISLPLCGTIKEIVKGIKIERGYPMPKITR